MVLRKRVQGLNTLMRIGLVFLILASLWRWFVHPSASFSEGFTDGAAGMLYGVSIGCLLWGVRMNARRRSNPDAGPCA